MSRITRKAEYSLINNVRIPPALEDYLEYYGCHFNKKLCEYAVSLMTKDDGLGNEMPITPITKEELDEKLKRYNIRIKNNVLYDYVFAANMCKADYLHESVVDEQHLCLYVKNTIDDVDGYDGIVFWRWYTDMYFKNIGVSWDDML